GPRVGAGNPVVQSAARFESAVRFRWPPADGRRPRRYGACLGRHAGAGVEAKAKPGTAAVIGRAGGPGARSAPGLLTPPIWQTALAAEIPSWPREVNSATRPLVERAASELVYTVSAGYAAGADPGATPGRGGRSAFERTNSGPPLLGRSPTKPDES